VTRAEGTRRRPGEPGKGDYLNIGAHPAPRVGSAGVLMTVEECPKCGVKLKRSFRDGDYVGKEGEVCEFCGSRMHVRMIFIEPVSPAR